MACLAGPRSNQELKSTGSGSEPGRGEAGCRHIGNIAQLEDQGQEPKLKGISCAKEGQESAECSHSSLSRRHSCPVKASPELKEPGPLER